MERGELEKNDMGRKREALRYEKELKNDSTLKEFQGIFLTRGFLKMKYNASIFLLAKRQSGLMSTSIVQLVVENWSPLYL